MFNFKEPILCPSGEYEPSAATYPMLGSGKIDGMRVIATDMLYSRSGNPLSNNAHDYFRDVLKVLQKHNLVVDCELWSPKLEFNEIMSWVANPVVSDNVKLHVFDMMTVEEWNSAGTEPEYMDRFEFYVQWFKRPEIQRVSDLTEPVDQAMINNAREADQLLKQCLAAGLEGMILRHPFGRYKHGRATMKENLIYKFKKWYTLDGKVVGFKQGTKMKEDAKRTENELGRKKQVHSQDDREKVEGIGSIEVEMEDGATCYIGGAAGFNWNGMTWQNREKYLGKWIEFKYQKHGTVNKPRFGRAFRWRPDKDGREHRALTNALNPPSSGDHKSTSTSWF